MSRHAHAGRSFVLSTVTAAAALSLLAAFAQAQQSVSSSCVGAYDANGNLVPCNNAPAQAPASTAQAPGSARPAQAPNAMQQMQLQGARNAGAALGNGIVNLFRAKPATTDDQTDQQQVELRQQQQQLGQQFQQQQLERQRREQDQAADQAAFQRQRDELLGSLKDDQAAHPDDDDDLHRKFAANEELFHDRVAWDEHLQAGLAHQRELTQENPKNTKNENWCKLHRPLLGAPDSEKSRWDGRCGPDVGRAKPSAPDGGQATNNDELQLH